MITILFAASLGIVIWQLLPYCYQTLLAAPLPKTWYNHWLIFTGLNTFLFVLINLRYQGMNSAILMLLTEMLLVCIWMDITHFLLLDCFTLPILGLGLLVSIQPIALGQPNFTNAISSGVLGLCMLWLPAWWFKKSKGYDGLGDGDIKLFAALACWFPLHLLPNMLLIACLFGMIWFRYSNHHYHQKIAFGPFLAFSCWLHFII